MHNYVYINTHTMYHILSFKNRSLESKTNYLLSTVYVSMQYKIEIKKEKIVET